jgi:ATP-dependent Clp protease ATP-binding subunit ClpC
MKKQMPLNRQFEILSPALGVDVQYRVLSDEEIERIQLQAFRLTRDDYVRLVLERVVQNLWSDVAYAIRRVTKDEGRAAVDALYRGCVMLNPGIDIEAWREMATTQQAPEIVPTAPVRVTKTMLTQIEKDLKRKVVAQDEPIHELMAALRRSFVGLGDEEHPIGVFVFAGASGVGKTLLAKLVHERLFGGLPVRIDCGEYQQKHSGEKLIGSPPGYVGYDEGGQLTNGVLKKPDTVVLFDEIEKAHVDIFDMLLRVVDEGVLTDSQGRHVTFNRALIIMTTNLGKASKPTIGFGSAKPDRRQVEQEVLGAVKRHFRPEFLNRVDKTIVFNELDDTDLAKVARLELEGVGAKLALRGFSLRFDDAAIAALAHEGRDPVQGVRSLVQARRRKVEGALTEALLQARHPKGSQFSLTWDGDYQVDVKKRATT